MTNETLTKVEHQFDKVAGKAGDTATAIISSAAGAAAEPRKGLSKVRAQAMRPPVLLALLAVAAIVVIRKMRSSQ